MVHTQNVESYLNRVKGKFKCMKGVHEEMMSSYLDRFMTFYLVNFKLSFEKANTDPRVAPSASCYSMDLVPLIYVIF